MLPERYGFLPALLLWYGLVVTPPVLAQLTERSTPDARKAEFVYSDVKRFVTAFEQLAESSDTLAVLQTYYLDAGSPGLAMFIDKYDLTAERLRKAIREHPEAYTSLSQRPHQLRAKEPSFRAAYGRLKGLVTDAVFPPTYFLIGAHRGIGSGSQEGPLVSIEKYTAEAIANGDMLPMLVHEMTHLQQVQAIGLEKYLAIYGNEKSLLAMTIREGIAEFAADWVLGEMTQEEARAYVVEHEASLWGAFQDEMMGAETGDWMWREPSTPGQPPHVAYVLGARIAWAYYDNAPDKDEAVREILAVTDYPAFLAKSSYEPSTN